MQGLDSNDKLVPAVLSGMEHQLPCQVSISQFGDGDESGFRNTRRKTGNCRLWLPRSQSRPGYLHPSL